MDHHGFSRLWIRLPLDLARALRQRAGSAKMASSAERAIRHELDRAELGEYLTELDTAFGPVPANLLCEARATWHRTRHP